MNELPAGPGPSADVDAERVKSADPRTGGNRATHIAKFELWENVQARIDQVSPKHPGEIMVGLNDRPPHMYHDVYRINLETGERTLVYNLTPQVMVPTEEILQRGDELRGLSRRERFVPPPPLVPSNVPSPELLR